MLVDMLATTVSIVAILLSGVTFGLSYRASRAAEQRARIPVLVFVYDGAQGWLLRNVGNGPALNIEVAQKVVRGERAGSWINPCEFRRSAETRRSCSRGSAATACTALELSMRTFSAPTKVLLDGYIP
jgi:hypothetical protein